MSRKPESHPRGGGAPAVLIVDDDVDLAQSLSQHLDRSGLPCTSANDGWTALRMIAEGSRPEVVISDLRMPELDGLEFVTRLLAIDTGPRPDIVFISGAAGLDDALAAIRLGATDLLLKPVEPGRLVQAAKAALLRRRMRASHEGPMAATDEVAGRRAQLAELRSVRRLRERYFASDLFSDPNWDMLLDLYDANLSGQDATTSSLGAASGVPLTTALRRMDLLQTRGLIEKVEDKVDRRRVLVRLTGAGLAAVQRFFESYSALRMKRVNGAGLQ